MELKERIEKVLSEILSDKYECKISLRFVPKDGAAACGGDQEKEGGNIGRSA